MKVQVIYTSLTGCTKKVAQAIYSGLVNCEKSIHDLADGIPLLDGDVILIGYWGKMGGPDTPMQEFLKTVHGKTVGIFCTLGYYADSDHAWQTLDSGIDLLKYDNQIIGSYVCNGAISPQLIAKQGLAGEHTPTTQKEIRWEIFKNHPTEEECALAAQRFRERIYLYSRCKELGIDMASIL